MRKVNLACRCDTLTLPAKALMYQSGCLTIKKVVGEVFGAVFVGFIETVVAVSAPTGKMPVGPVFRRDVR